MRKWFAFRASVTHTHTMPATNEQFVCVYTNTYGLGGHPTFVRVYSEKGRAFDGLFVSTETTESGKREGR